MIVVDSNVLAARNLEGPLAPLAERVGERDPVWVVPPLWRYEFQNILAVAMRMRRIAPEQALAAWRKVADQMTANEYDPDPVRVLDLAGQYRITAYDATFIALAMEMGIPCITEDGELQRKFPLLAVSMATFAKQGGGETGVRESRARYRSCKRK